MSNAAPSRLTSARKKCSACRARARSITASTSNSTLATSNRAWPARNGRRIGSTWASSEAHFDLCWSSHCRKVATESRSSDLEQRHLVHLNGSAPETEKMVSTDRQDQGIEPGDELNKVEMVSNRPTPDAGGEIEAESSEVFHRGQSRIGHGSVLIAAITSCTNTSNPSVMLAAGLLAKKAVRTRPNDRSSGQDFARAGLARRLRLFAKNRAADISRSTRIQHRRLRLHHLHRQLRARFIRRSRRRSQTTISSRPRSCPATAISKRASIKTSRPTSSCRRRWSSLLRSPGGSIST